MRSIQPRPQIWPATLDLAAKLNGEHVADGFGAAVRHQIDETKPILPPEAG